jgi:hypothetical protein
MKALKMLSLGALVLLALLAFDARAEALRRQYYGSSWSYYPQRTYYYNYYYFKPYVEATDYSYHYCIYYPTQPRYIYYYNPVKQVYWGRYDTQGKEGACYSLLKDEDRKKKLEDIPETAFPKPGEMPRIPESKDDERILPPPVEDLPKK